MSKYEIIFQLKEMPTSPEKAEDLSQEMTDEYGGEGYQLVSALSTSGGKLLLIFQTEVA